MLDSNTWNNLTVCKQMIDIDRIITVRLQYMKPFNCVQTNEF